MPRSIEYKSDSNILDFITSHSACTHFSDSDKSKIKRAFEVARKLHKGQLRLDWKPYITHIYSTLRIYLEDLPTGARVSANDIISLILHDAVEDGENAILKLLEAWYSYDIIIDVLWMTQPSRDILLQLIQKLPPKYNWLLEKIQEAGIWKLYSIFAENIWTVNEDKIFELINSYDAISHEMKIKLKAIWVNRYALKYLQTTKQSKQEDVLSEFLWLCLLAMSPPHVFRLKSADRRHNLQDVEWLLKGRKVDSAQRTRESTWWVYVPRARELWMHDVAVNLIFDVNKQRQAMIGTQLTF